MALVEGTGSMAVGTLAVHRQSRDCWAFPLACSGARSRGSKLADRWVSCRGARQCVPVSGRRLVLGPQAFCGKGVGAVGYSTVIAGSHPRHTQGTVACDGAQASGEQVRSGRCGPTVYTPQWGPLQRSRVCLAPRAAADIRVDCQSGSCAPGGAGGWGGEEGDIQAAGVCKDETDRKEASVVKSAAAGGGWWLCQPLVS